MQQMILTVCISCLLVGALRGLLPESSFSRVINQLCVLYILLSAFTAFEAAPRPRLAAFLAQPVPAAKPLDLSAEVQQHFCGEIATRAEALLRENGLSASARCLPEGEGLLLELTVPGTDEARQAEALFAEAWREGIPYHIGVEGGASHE